MNFSYGAIWGIEAYFSALLALKLDLNLLLGLLLAGFFSVLVGLPPIIASLRLKHIAYIAIATLAYGEILRLIVVEWDELTRGVRSLWGIPPFPTIHIGNLEINFYGFDRSPFYYLSLIIFLVVFLSFIKLHRSKWYYTLKTIKTDDILAETLGIDVIRSRLLCSIIALFLAGIAGSLYAHYIQVLTPSMMEVSTSFELFLMDLLGGAGTVLGPIFGSFILIFVLEALRVTEEIRFIIFGGMIICLIIFLPQGLSALLKYLKRLLK